MDLEKVEKYWPDRGIFQGSARAYIRFCEQPQPTWDCLEKPLWQLFFSIINNKRFTCLGCRIWSWKTH